VSKNMMEMRMVINMMIDDEYNIEGNDHHKRNADKM